MESKRYPTEIGEVSEVVECGEVGNLASDPYSSYGAYMLIGEDLPTEWQEAIRWLNTQFAPNFRLIYKPTGSAMPYGMMGSVGWKTRKPEPKRVYTASEVLNGWESETK